jgi:hypothetical protein
MHTVTIATMGWHACRYSNLTKWCFFLRISSYLINGNEVSLTDVKTSITIAMTLMIIWRQWKDTSPITDAYSSTREYLSGVHLC